ncbi:MAG TPA: helix-turn-helix domain-containing protein [Chitinophagaceae bacterium]|jgi:transcriptional regulator GlxA family with amidase domain|nr:helix-turn-helix domain-containing protein [Chitinophagaceae bacterium]
MLVVVTGKRTSLLIARRIVAEATDLLRHSNLSVWQIACAPGFQNPAHFNNFYKKQKGITPKESCQKRIALVNSLV